MAKDISEQDIRKAIAEVKHPAINNDKVKYISHFDIAI